METFIARQPILDSKQRLFGYELLFRSGIENVFRGENPEIATTKLISDVVHIHGVDKITQGHKCFVNFTRQAILSELYSVLPREWAVIEMLETVELDGDLIDACHRLRRTGYLLALDDYVLDPRFESILPLIDFLKVEFPVLTDHDHRVIRDFSDRHGFSLLAEKVEDQEQFHRAKDFGYDYFQGYFFCKPQLITARQIPSSRLQSLRLLQLVNDPAFDIDQIEQVIRNDVSLSYKLLRYLNSSRFSGQQKIQSIRQAMAILGQRGLHQWASVVTIGGMSGEKPEELLSLCLIRARFTELIGKKCLRHQDSSECFTAGMFSLLDALLDQPMEQMVQELGLSPFLIAALLEGDSPIRQVIGLAVAIENGDWTGISNLSRTLGIDETTVFAIYRDCEAWAGKTMREMTGTE